MLLLGKGFWSRTSAEYTSVNKATTSTAEPAELQQQSCALSLVPDQVTSKISHQRSAAAYQQCQSRDVEGNKAGAR